MSSSSGTLSNGTPYVVYRILLYCDDFQKSSARHPEDSAGGCYFLALSLSPEHGRAKYSVRIISLTPPGISTNEVPNVIVDDLVNAAVHGVDRYTPTGEYLKVFIDPVAFVGDYPAATGTIDVRGHISRACCTHCTFRRLHEADTTGSRFGYTTGVHSRNSAFIRNDQRHKALRDANLSKEDARRLGMISNDNMSSSRCPLIHLQRCLENDSSRGSLTSSGARSVACIIDAYRSNVIAQDHLLSGLAKDILNAFFISLPSDALRRSTDISVCAALQENGLLPQKEIFNKRTNMIHSMTLSELFCVLPVSAPVAKITTKEFPEAHIARKCQDIMSKLQKLMAFTYWRPKVEVDGIKATKMVQSENQVYISDLRVIAKRYVRAADKVCSISPKSKQQLDKPNLHRVLELYEHTIPAFGHVREITELAFESAYQPLKRCISRSNNRKSHLFAVENCVANNWQGRLAASRTFFDHHNDENISLGGESSRYSMPSWQCVATARRGVRRLMIGEEADLLDEHRHNEFIKLIDDLLDKQFTRAVLKRFEKDGMISNFNATRRSVWKGRGKKSLSKLSVSAHMCEEERRRVIQDAIRWINALMPCLNGTGAGQNFILYQSERRVQVGEDGKQIGKPPGHDIIFCNCALQIQLDPGSLTHKILGSAPHSETARPYLFVVLCILQRKEDVVFAVGYRCLKRGDVIFQQDMRNESFKLVIQTDNIRRVAVYHACDKNQTKNERCVIDKTSRKLQHVTSLLQGGEMYFQCRQH